MCVCVCVCVCMCVKRNQNIRRQDLLSRTPLYLTNKCRLCSEHFEIDQFINKETKNRFECDTVPTLFKEFNPPKQLSK